MFEYSKFDDDDDVKSDSFISNTNLNDSVTNQVLVQDALSRRDQLKAILSSKPIHILVISLIVLDCIFVLIELLIDTNSIKIEEDNPFSNIIHGFSIAVLSAFMIEICLKIYVDYKHFFSHKIEILDGIVVLVSFVVDIILTVYEDNDFLAVASLLILLRLVRIVNGFVVTAKAQADERVRTVKKKNKDLEELLEKSQSTIKLQDEKIKKLIELLSDHGIESDMPSRSELFDRGSTNV